MLLLIALGNQWQRYILAYVNAVDVTKYDSKFAIGKEYAPDWKDTYGVLSGLAFTGPFAILGVFAGIVSDNVNRKLIVVICGCAWSACTLVSGIFDSFTLFIIMRCLLGLFEAFMNPTAYSLIADYYPPSMRTRAASVFNLAIYFGGAMSSLSSIIIYQFGWRAGY